MIARFAAMMTSFMFGGWCIMIAAGILPVMRDFGYVESVALMACVVGLIMAFALAIGTITWPGKRAGSRPG
jgi:undecaprenyl pyrophosphate phosphatase UppP